MTLSFSNISGCIWRSEQKWERYENMQICFAFRDLRAVAKALERWTNSNSIRKSCKNLKQAQNFCHLLCTRTLSFFPEINFGTFLDISHLWVNSYFQVCILFDTLVGFSFSPRRQQFISFYSDPVGEPASLAPIPTLVPIRKGDAGENSRVFYISWRLPGKCQGFLHFLKNPILRWHKKIVFWKKETISSWDINFWQQMSRRSELSCWNFDILDTSWEIESQMFWLEAGT